MNFFKSLFVPAYMMFLMGLTGFALWNLTHGGPPLAWGGVMLTSAPLLMIIGYIVMTQSIARTSAHFPLVNLIGALGAALAVAGQLSNGGSFLPVDLAVGGWVGFLIYSYWYSGFAKRGSPQINLGSRLPNFTLMDTRGAKVTSASLTGRPTIFVFYRGNWCPLCMAQIKELAGRYKDISTLGVRVALVSPQPHENTIKLAKKYGVSFDFLTDRNNVAARALGIAMPWGVPMGMQMLGYQSETVLPTVIITDGNGLVVWAHETDNYRIRPEPDTYLQVLRDRGLVTAVS
ncbi:MAG: AhpC/TSA family protein [Alphaproteobacteria bacterium]|nr:AhpC/TSA family protein [Alphaproteobacteria bacterium]